ncbi:amine dehydrogenase large subunit [Gluconacetobacter tumulicola]|uniref:Amine dehydrogenase n=1 Tax=Gluconacetobacter tumulicola TaxID=1017177 RepID=A0A7W4JAK2_9PROT|nr:amine dehydrogenase large subunit [Gluconacetobacter tumulicola]MBB2177725.1 hypothetical protein [Gluconacetobacter tumulicola]
MAKMITAGSWLILLTLFPIAVHADEAAFVPETVTVKTRISPGPNVLVNQMGMASSTLYIYSAQDLTLKGSVSGGAWGLSTLSRDGNTAYMASSFFSRITYGTGEDILQVFDVPTNTVRKEIRLPFKVTQYTPDASQLRLSADEKFIYVQNATPATSVTVVNLESAKVSQEIPQPGCYGIYPATEGHSFSTICTDGSFMTFSMGADGTTFTSRKSEKIFDVDNDPIYLASARAGDDLLFISYNANVYRLSDKSGVIRKVNVTSLTRGVSGNWGTSGYGVLSYNDANNVLFVTMYPNHHEGTHHRGGKQIWAYDLARGTLLSRSPVNDISTIAVSTGEKPSLYGLNMKKNFLEEYAVDRNHGFSLKKTTQHTDFGFATMIMGNL